MFFVTEWAVHGSLADQLELALFSQSDKDAESKSEADKKSDDKKSDSKKTGKSDKSDKKHDAKVAPIKIDFDGLAQRIVRVPVDPANLDELRAIDGKLH